MKLKVCTVEEFVQKIQSGKLYCFGASQMPREMCEEYSECAFEQKIEAFVDNDVNKWGSFYGLHGRQIRVISLEQMLKVIDSRDIVLITSKYYVDIFEQLDQVRELDDVSCYIWPMVAPQYKRDRKLGAKIRAQWCSEEQIPKKIHYVWFGGKELPEIERQCVETWKRYCPKYELVRWDESNYDVTKNEYMRQAYEAKKWAFASDYARLDIIYEHGGIYLDMDVEVLHEFDSLLRIEAFVGFESKNLVNLGLGFGAKPKHPLVKIMRDDYANRQFLKADGTYDLTACPFIQTECLQKYGLKLNNKFQMIENMAILPAECFSPDNNMIPHVTENTFSIHHFAGSWTSNENKALLRRMRDFSRKVI